MLWFGVLELMLCFILLWRRLRRFGGRLHSGVPELILHFSLLQRPSLVRRAKMVTMITINDDDAMIHHILYLLRNRIFFVGQEPAIRLVSRPELSRCFVSVADYDLADV